jgi:uncharacterized membrane protein YesL
MSELVQSFLDNESPFGRLMTRLGIIIVANVLFVLFSMPVVTMGAAYVALYHVMLKTLRGDGVINPFRQFWRGFRSNFKQATLYWIALLALLAFGAFDVALCTRFGGPFVYVKYAIFAFGAAALVVTIYMGPTMAAFANTIPNLMKSALYFAIKKPFKLVVILFFNVFPMILTYSDLQTLPLYAFLWTTCGFGLVALLESTLLLPEFKPFLPEVDACGDFILDPEDEAKWADSPQAVAQDAGAPEKSEAEILEEMKKLDGF